MAEGARTRLASYMDDRRQTLRMTWKQVSDKAGLSPQGLRDVRSGEGTIRPLTKRGLEDALEWTPGSIDKILAGSEPEVPGSGGDVALRRTDELLDERQRILDEIDELLQRATPRQGRAALAVLKELVDEGGDAEAS